MLASADGLAPIDDISDGLIEADGLIDVPPDDIPLSIGDIEAGLDEVVVAGLVPAEPVAEPPVPPQAAIATAIVAPAATIL
jgi:hypothetical protein